MRATALVLCVVGCGASAVTSVPAHEPEVSAPTPVDDRSRGRLALGDGFGCALLDGGPRCWGTPPLGAGVDLAHPAPLVDAIELSASMERLCARFPGGAVRCWDQDVDDPSEGSVTSPTIPPARRVWASDPPCALTEDDELWCWSTERVTVDFPMPDGEAEEEDDDRGLDETYDSLTGDDDYVEPPSFGRVAVVPGAVDLQPVSESLVYVLDAEDRVSRLRDGEVAGVVTIPGAVRLEDGADQQSVVVFLEDGGTRRLGAGYGELTAVEGPAAIDIARFRLTCVLDSPEHAVCRSTGADAAGVEIVGPTGMTEIAVNETSACVLTAAGEVLCVDVRSPTAVFELARASTGLSEEGHVVCAEGDPWICQRELGGPTPWPSREASCSGADWISPYPEPGPSAPGWMHCGTELRATAIDFDTGGVRPVRVPGVTRVYGVELGLVLATDRGGVRFFSDSPGEEYATASAPLAGFDHLRDFDQEATHRCGILRDGTVRCASATGDEARNVPIDVAALSDAVEIETAANCACVRTSAGTVTCVDLDYRAQPSAARDVGISGALELVSNNDSMCARTSDGRVICAADEFGTIPAREPPEDGETRCGTFAPTILEDVVEIEAGSMFVCARQASGRVLCWGQLHEGPRATDVEALITPDRTPIRVAP